MCIRDRVLIYNVTVPEALSYKEKLGEIDGVTDVTWLDDAVTEKQGMSRLGRNYLQVGFYTEMLFPQKGVRFIAVNDNVDSANGGMDNDFTPLRNLFNEWLVRDTSKKIKAVKRAKGMSGKPVTSTPVYGYLMDERCV